MKRLFFIILYLCLSINIILSQKIEQYDYMIDMKYYKAYYCKDIQTSSFVIYKMYKGGGDVSRSGMNFKKYKNLDSFEYTNSGYDRGHLVPAEDMAWSEQSLQSTFYYINCIPQTPKLNRSIWRVYENEIREISQNDSLIIICGGCDYDDINIGLPQNCFKIVYRLKDGKCLYSLLFENGWNNKVKTENKLKEQIPYKKAKQLYYAKNRKN